MNFDHFDNEKSNGDKNYLQDDISLSLEYYNGDRGWEKPTSSEMTKRYLLCPAAATIGHLIKFLRMRYEINTADRVDIIYNNVPLREKYSLAEVISIFLWNRDAPMRFFYRINEAQKLEIAEPPITIDQAPISDPVLQFSDDMELVCTIRVNQNFTAHYHNSDQTSDKCMETVETNFLYERVKRRREKQRERMKNLRLDKERFEIYRLKKKQRAKEEWARLKSDPLKLNAFNKKANLNRLKREQQKIEAAIKKLTEGGDGSP